MSPSGGRSTHADPENLESACESRIVGGRVKLLVCGQDRKFLADGQGVSGLADSGFPGRVVPHPLVWTCSPAPPARS